MNPQWLCLCQGCLFQTMSPQYSSFDMLPPRSHSEASHMSQQTNACTTSGSTHPHQLQDFKRTFTREDHEKYWTLADKRPSMCMFQGQGVMRGGGVFWILSDQGTFEFISSSSSSFCIKIVPVQIFFSYKTMRAPLPSKCWRGIFKFVSCPVSSIVHEYANSKTDPMTTSMTKLMTDL